MSDLSQELLARMAQAQSPGTTPPGDLPFRNITDLLLRQVDLNESNPFLIYYPDNGQRKEYSYREFHDAVSALANILRQRGVQPGDRIAIASQNHSDAVIAYFAVFLAGATAVPVNVDEDDRRISYVLRHSRSVLAFVQDQFLERIIALRPEAPSLKTILQVGQRVDPPLLDLHTEAATHTAEIPGSHAARPDDEALIIYTSGTTGNPKGVVLTHGNLLVEAMSIAEWHRLSSDQRMMCVTPLHHVNGIVGSLLTPLCVGGSVVVNQRFHAQKFFERLSFEKVSVASVVPTILQFLIHTKASIAAYQLASFRHLICAGGPLTVDLAQRFEQMYKIPVIHGYGLSETSSFSSFLPINLTAAEHRHWMSKCGFPSVGVTLPTNEMAIHDAAGTTLGEGERGEIVIRGYNVMKRYDEEPLANQEAFAHGWFRTGDEGFFRYDEQERKFFFITGRIKELIIRGGTNISPIEIDEVLMKIPGIQAGIAVGFENVWYGEEVGAYVVAKEGTELHDKDVIAHCRKQLPFAKSPKVVVFGNEIPGTLTGNYRRDKFRERFAAWKEVQFTSDGQHQTFNRQKPENGSDAV
jgi:long-chain acyl-CoA synthetase